MNTLKLLMFLILIVVLATCSSNKTGLRNPANTQFDAQITESDSKKWKFVVVSDIHVSGPTNKRKVAGFIKAIVDQALAEKVEFVIVTGDLFRANKGKRNSAKTVNSWKSIVDQAFRKLIEEKVPVIFIPGNHDIPHTEHRVGLEATWKGFQETAKQLNVRGKPPYYYWFEHKEANFCFLSLTDTGTFKYDREKLEVCLGSENPGKKQSFAFGHVPIFSAVMGKMKARYAKILDTFSRQHLNAYFCGHEHLYWEWQADVPSDVKQFMVNSAMGDLPGQRESAYVFPIAKKLFNANCDSNGECVMPVSKKRFLVNPKTREQNISQGFLMVEVDNINNSYVVQPKTFDENGIMRDFFIE